MSHTFPQAVLFDLDGTLLNTIPDIAGAVNRSLAGEGLPTWPVEAYRHFVGSGIRVAIRRAAPAGTDPAVLEAVHARYQADYPLHCTDQTACYDGIRSLLARLQQAGVPMAVITNKTETTSQKIIRHFFPETAFRFVWGSNDIRPLKPDAEAGRLACRALALPAQEIAFLGDSDVDVFFARNAGFVSLGAGWGFRGAEELRQAGADVVCQSPAEVQNWLDQAC